MFNIFSLEGIMLVSLLEAEQKRNKEKNNERTEEKREEKREDNELFLLIKELKEFFNGNVF